MRSEARNTSPSEVALALVTRRDGRVLLVHEGHGPLAGWWLLPGGGVEPGESVEAAARRECREETGLTLTDARFAARYDVRYPAGALTLHVFRAELDDSALAAEEGSEARWRYARGEDVHPTVRRIVLDAGLATDDPGAIARALEAAGIAMRSVEG